MFDFSVFLIEDFFPKGFCTFDGRTADGVVSGSFVFLQADLGKVSCRFVVLVLGPTFEGVVVAFVAVEPNGQEQMGGVLDGFFGRAQDLVIGCGGVFAIRARGSEDLVSELVVGFVGRKAVADPIFEFGCTFFTEELRVDLEQIGPFVGPVIDEPIAADEFIDNTIAFDSAFGRIGQKRPDRFGGRRNACEVQGHSP